MGRITPVVVVVLVLLLAGLVFLGRNWSSGEAIKLPELDASGDLGGDNDQVHDDVGTNLSASPRYPWSVQVKRAGDGAAIPGCRVVLTRLDGRYWVGRTDEAGEILVPLEARNSVKLEVIVTGEGLACSFAEYRIEDLRRGVKLEMSPGSALTARIKDDSGTPVSGVAVGILFEKPSVMQSVIKGRLSALLEGRRGRLADTGGVERALPKSDDQGCWRLTGLPRAQAMVRAFGSGGVILAKRNVLLEDGHHEVDLVISSEKDFTVRVLAEDNAPVEGARTWLLVKRASSWFPLAEGISGRDGMVVFLNIMVGAGEKVIAWSEFENQWASSSDAEHTGRLEVVLDRDNTQRGRVFCRDSKGELLRPQSVRFYALRSPSVCYYESQQVLEDGSVEIPFYFLGERIEAVARLAAEDQANTRLQGTSTFSGEEAEVTITFLPAPKGRRRGVIELVFPSDLISEDVSIFVSGYRFNHREQYSVAAQTKRLPGVLEGLKSVVVQHKLRGYFLRDVDVVPGSTRTLHVDFQNGRSIKLMFENESKEIGKHFMWHLMIPTGLGGGMACAQSGAVRFGMETTVEGIPGSTCFFCVTEGLDGSAMYVGVARPSDKRLTIPVGRKSVGHRVTLSAEGDVPRGCMACLDYLNGPMSLKKNLSGQSAVFEGLVPGLYRGRIIGPSRRTMGSTRFRILSLEGNKAVSVKVRPHSSKK